MLRRGETVPLKDLNGNVIRGAYLTDGTGAYRYNFRKDAYAGRAGVKGPPPTAKAWSARPYPLPKRRYANSLSHRADYELCLSGARAFCERLADEIQEINTREVSRALLQIEHNG